MHTKSIFSFVILGLMSLAKINGYSDKCNEIYKYLQSQEKRVNYRSCSLNDDGNIKNLMIFPFCLNNKQLDTILSYNTTETLTFSDFFMDWDIDDSNDMALTRYFGCASLPTNYKKLRAFNNLKTLNLSGVINLDNKIVANIPISVEQLTLRRAKITQEMVNSLSKLINLNSLTFLGNEISEELDFSDFKNLEKLTTLNIHYDAENKKSTVHENILKYCKSVENLIVR